MTKSVTCENWCGEHEIGWDDWAWLRCPMCYHNMKSHIEDDS